MAEVGHRLSLAREPALPRGRVAHDPKLDPPGAAPGRRLRLSDDLVRPEAILRGSWMKQVGRNLADGVDGFLEGMRSVIHVGDSLLTDELRRVLRDGP
jgi:hypothetical protein